MEYKVSLTPQARRDLASIWRFIARNDRETATNFCRDLAHYAHTLETFPDRAAELPSRRHIRKVPFRAYLVFYKIDEKSLTVQVLRFWHSARDQRRLRLKEEASPGYSASPSAVPAVQI